MFSYVADDSSDDVTVTSHCVARADVVDEVLLKK